MFTTTDLFGRFHSPRHRLPAARAQLPASPNELAKLFQNRFPAHWLSAADQGPNSRERLYTLAVTFWTFLWQVLHPGSPCSDAVCKVIAWLASLGRPHASDDTSPYCQARARVPKSILQNILGAVAQNAEQRVRSHWRFHDYDVKVGDGTTLLAPDTPKNQKAFPQSTRQKEGCGFPLLKLVALFSLSSGALLHFTLGNKHDSELGLFRRLWRHLKKGDLFLADRLFCDYVTIAGLWRRAVASVLRLNECRTHDFRKGKRLGPYDRLVTWHKPERQRKTATRRVWNALPAQLTLRLIRYPICLPGFRPKNIILVTTLLDPIAYPASDLAQLYLRRWSVELFFRHIKTTMQMDMLRCLSPAMLSREVLMHLIAYNLIRALMAEAAAIYDQEVARISFKGSVQAVRHFSQVIAQAPSRRKAVQLTNDLLQALAKALVPHRPGRTEPRVKKRRHKRYPLMTLPRNHWKAHLHSRRTMKNQGA